MANDWGSLVIFPTNETRASTAYQDGDVVEFFTRKHIRARHAQDIALPHKAGFNGNGLRPIDSVAHRVAEVVAQWKFQRLKGSGYVVKIELATSTLLATYGPKGSPAPMAEVPHNPDGTSMLVSRHIADVLAAGENHFIFGAQGSEFWYGGREDWHGKIDQVWTLIETHSPEREENHAEWPHSPAEKKEFLCLRTDDATPEEAEDLTTVVYDVADEINAQISTAQRQADGNVLITLNRAVTSPKGSLNRIVDKDGTIWEVGDMPDPSQFVTQAQGTSLPITGPAKVQLFALVKKRKHKMDWRDFPGMGPHVNDILNKQVEKDLRAVVIKVDHRKEKKVKV